jgi:hypothetical protein
MLLAERGRVVALRVQSHSGLVGAFIVLVLVALVAAEAAGVVYVVRRTPRLTRPARFLVVIVGVWTILAAGTVFVQDLRPAHDWGGALVSGFFIVLYGLIGCGVVLLVDAFVKRLHQPKRVDV